MVNADAAQGQHQAFVSGAPVCNGAGVDDAIEIDLPPVYRVALGSAAVQDRASFSALFALDARLGRAVAEASEPIIAQVKLAWWRDRFAQAPSEWPIGEPLLAQLTTWGAHSASLGKLVDGWEELVNADGLTPEAAERFAESRIASWQTLAEVIGVADPDEPLRNAARSFTLADMAERGFRDAAASIDDGSHSAMPRRLPRRLRPFAVLGSLGRRSVSKNRPMLDGFPSLALALRTGLTGL